MLNMFSYVPLPLVYFLLRSVFLSFAHFLRELFFFLLTCLRWKAVYFKRKTAELTSEFGTVVNTVAATTVLLSSLPTPFSLPSSTVDTEKVKPNLSRLIWALVLPWSPIIANEIYVEVGWKVQGTTLLSWNWHHTFFFFFFLFILTRTQT